MSLNNATAQTDEALEEGGICKVCSGKGQYHRRVNDDDFETIEVVICEACDGTGYDKEDGDVD